MQNYRLQQVFHDAQSQVPKGRPYPTPICNVGFSYYDLRIPGCRSHRSQAIAHASVGMTWLLNSAAAIDARHHTYPRRHGMAAGAIRIMM